MDLWAILNAADAKGGFVFEPGDRRVLADITNENALGTDVFEGTSFGCTTTPDMEVHVGADYFASFFDNWKMDSVVEGDEVPIDRSLSASVEPVSIKGRQIVPAKRSYVKRKGWSYVTQFTIDPQHWSRLHVGLELDEKYVEYFTNHLMSKCGISCVLKSAGPYISYGKFKLRFNCTNKPCKRCFLVTQIAESNFNLFDNGEPENHDGNERARPVRNIKRAIVTKGLIKMNPEDYLMFCQNGVNQLLYQKGHLQDLISSTTATKIRNVGLVNEQDYDRDDIIDILKMKLSDEYNFNVTKEAADIFIRRFNLDPFAILMYSNAQLTLLRNLSLVDDNLKMFFDSTGGVARHAKKRVFYYSGVCVVKKNTDDIKEKARLQPIFEALSGEHDAPNIRLLLEDIKNNYEVKYPHSKWPICYTITDFSFALINAICKAWNNMSLLRYINLTYKYANDIDFKNKLSEYGLDTFIHLCCGHFSKTQCNDITKYFPNLDSKAQSILKEILIAMYDIGDLKELRLIWTNLSTILMSRYVDQNVENALKNLTDVILNKPEKPKTDNEAEENDEDDEMPDDKYKFLPMYKRSDYYKDFSQATFKPELHTETKLNTFYNAEFASVF